MLFQINYQLTVDIYSPPNIDTGNTSILLNTSNATTNKPTTTASLTTTSSTTTTIKPEPTTTIITKSQPTSHVKLAFNKQASIITIITQPKTFLKPVISKDNLDSLQAPNKETTHQVRTIEPQSQSPNQPQPLQTRSQAPKKKRKLQRKNYQLKSKQPSIKIQLLLSPSKSVRKPIPHKLPLKPNKQQGRKKPQQKKIYRQTKQKERLNQQLLNKKPLHNQNIRHRRKLEHKRSRSHSQRQPKVNQGTIPRRKLPSRRKSPNRMGRLHGSTYTKTTITPDSVAQLSHSEHSLSLKSSMTPEIKQ